jgi:PAS domain S-box-containing protein
MWSPLKVFSIGVLIAVLLSLFVYWQIKHASVAFAQQNNTDNIGPYTYLKSAEFKRMFCIYLAGVLVILAINAYFFIQQEFSSVNSRLLDDVSKTSALIEQQNRTYLDDLEFLSATSSVQILKELSKQNLTLSEQNLKSTMLERLSEIFRAYMVASPDVFQVRLIQNNEKGNELVRVERIGSAILTADSLTLQEKADSPYFKQALESSGDNVLISDIEPNAENGAVVTPILPTLRYIKKVKAANGSVSALLVINVNAGALIAQIGALSQADEFIFLTNQRNEFIIGNDSILAFDSAVKWDDVFTRASKPVFTSELDFTVWEDSEKQLIAIERKMIPNQQELYGQVSVIGTFDISAVYENILWDLLKLAMILLSIGLVLVIPLYFAWSGKERSLLTIRQQKELEAQQRKDIMFKGLIELSPEAMLFTDINGQILLVNTQTERLFGYSRGQLIGQSVNMLIPKDSADGYDFVLQDYVNKTKAHTIGEANDLSALHEDGSEFTVEVTIGPIQLDDDLLIALSVRDVTKRKLQEEVMKRAVEETKLASEAKSAFLANMSHEIRTPLNAVIGLAHLLKEEDLAERHLNLVNKIQLAGRSLLGIVNDVLDLSKIEANKVQVNEEPCQLGEVLHELHTVFSEQANTKNLQLNLEIDKNLPLWVQSDRKLLVQILTNLLANAIKFTAHGSVTLSAHCVESDTLPYSQQLVRFIVEDTGIGIAEVALEKIFQPFSQEDASTTRRFGGTGLGLSIVKTLTALLGGTVGVESQHGKGTKFCVTIPFMLSDSHHEGASDSIVDILRIWLVDDDRDDRQRLETAGKALGWSITSFDSALKLIASIEESMLSNSSLPDVLLVDWEMPEMNGLTAINVLYEKLGRKALPAIMVISAHDIDYIRAQDRQRLVDGYLHKPVSPSALFNAVNETVVKHTGSPERVLSSTKIETLKAKWLPNVRILVVDDSEINLEVVGSILTRNGAHVQTADSGAKALALLKENNNAFDIVLMDVQMPVMDGLQTVSNIRKRLKLKELPVVALTAGTSDEERRNALSAGMNDFLTKPVEPTRLINTVRKIVEKYRGAAILIEAMNVNDESSENDAWPSIVGLQKRANIFQGDLTLFTHTLERLIKEHANLEAIGKEQTPELSDNKKRQALISQVHKLRGISGTVGATELYDLASEAELQLRNSADNASDILERLAHAITALRQNAQGFLEEQNKNTIVNNAAGVSGLEKINTAELALLIEKLENHDLSASHIVTQQADSIKMLVGHHNFDVLQKMMLDLEYEAAASLLNKHLH